MDKDFFPPRIKSNPRIYAYEDTNPKYKDLLKIGFTTLDVQSRIAQQYPTIRPDDLPYRILLDESAMRSDGSTFTDHAVHRYLKKRGFIKEGYYADIVLIDTKKDYNVTKDSLLYKCNWSPFEGQTFDSSIFMTFVNGQIVYDKGKIVSNPKGRQLIFDR